MRAARISARWAGITSRGRPPTGCSGWSRRGGFPARRGRCRWARWCSSRGRSGSAMCWAAWAARGPGRCGRGWGWFEPGGIRVSDVLGSLGGPGAGPVLAATSDEHVVTIPLSTAQEPEVAVGDAVTVTLPDNASTPGTVSSVGTVASGTASNATIQVTVTLTHPSVAGTLDQAPVTVYITTASISNVLVVPVGALVAQPSGGGYAVEGIGAGNTRRLVPVTVGIFDDNPGLVQATGARAPGERVGVPPAPRSTRPPRRVYGGAGLWRRGKASNQRRPEASKKTLSWNWS